MQDESWAGMNSRLASLLRRRLSADADGEHKLRLECPELQ
jgi:hypothetical protein